MASFGNTIFVIGVRSKRKGWQKCRVMNFVCCTPTILYSLFADRFFNHTSFTRARPQCVRADVAIEAIHFEVCVHTTLHYHNVPNAHVQRPRGTINRESSTRPERPWTKAILETFNQRGADPCRLPADNLRRPSWL